MRPSGRQYCIVAAASTGEALGEFVQKTAASLRPGPDSSEERVLNRVEQRLL
jgi:hypothetical protein